MASDDWPDERARATAVVGNHGIDESADGRTYDRKIHDRSDPGAWDREPGTGRRRLALPVAASVAILAVFGGALWYAYNQGLEDGGQTEIPMVKADAGPIKIKPDDPGGLQVPNQDSLVMNRTGDDGKPIRVERLLPEPETPQPLEPLKRDGEAAGAEDSPAVTDGADESTELAGVSSDRVAEADGPTAAPLPSAGATTVDQSQPGRATSASNDVETTQDSPQGETAGAATAKTDRSAKPSRVQVTEVKKGDTVIQLASVASNDAAVREWGRLQKVFPDLLGDMVLKVQKVTVNGKEYHRMQTGPFPNRATAQDMCAQLKAQKQACLVTRR